MSALLIAARYEGYGDEFIKAQTRKSLGAMGGTLINTAIAGNNYERAAGLMNEFNEVLSPEQRNAFTKAIEQKRRTQVENSLAQSIYNQFGDDLGAAYDHIQNLGAGDMMSFDQLFDSMTQQESGGNANAVNARTGAYGSLQIMPENWASWSKEALGYVGDMKDPETYSKVARHKLQQYYNAYGAEGAMVAWYAGLLQRRNRLQRPVKMLPCRKHIKCLQICAATGSHIQRLWRRCRPWAAATLTPLQSCKKWLSWLMAAAKVTAD